MLRDLPFLNRDIFDVAIIGGGIYGASIAWEAASRGLSVALLEKRDFASATSANSMKIVHGGFRYLQHADLKRMRESMSERKTLMRITPHLVSPLPVLIPTYGHGMRGREVFTLALLANDLLSMDRNGLADPLKFIPRGRSISREECLQLLPEVDSHGLTGGAIFYDAQIRNSERLVLAFLHSAALAGAALANYTAVTGFLRNGDRVTGLQAVDLLSGESFDVRARMVVNSTGPWLNELLRLLDVPAPLPATSLTKAVNLITRPMFKTKMAVGMLGRNGYGDGSELTKRDSSFIFIVPWNGHSIVGTTYQPYTGHPDSLSVSQDDIFQLIHSVNQAYPKAGLKLDDVRFFHVGLLPAGQSPTGLMHVTKRYSIDNHQSSGIRGLISVMGVKYTTARDVARKTVDHISRDLGRSPAPTISDHTPLFGGEISNLELYLATEITKQPYGLGAGQIRQLVENYGSCYHEVLDQIGEERIFGTETAQETYLDRELLSAQVRYAVRHEMAHFLSDVIFRRTELGSAGPPAAEDLQLAGKVMAEELDWSEKRLQREIELVHQAFLIGKDTSSQTGDQVDAGFPSPVIQ